MTTTTRQLPRSQRQAAILRGAAKAFAHGGYAATSMEDIASASGITKLIVYRHFESKQDLYQAVLQRVSERLREEIRAEMERGAGRPIPPEGDGFSVRAVLKIAREEPEGFSLLWRHAAREPQFAAYAAEYRERAVRGASSRLQHAVDDPVMLRWAAETVISFLVAAVLNWLDVGTPSRDEKFLEQTSRAMREIVAAFARGEEKVPGHGDRKVAVE
jgi:AcrR family transcriptional regulator